MGSLVAALASYVQARSQRGRWLVRIEDIDPPREIDGAAAEILTSLAAHHLHHDGAVLYQSQQTPLYESALQGLRLANRLYACRCTRAQLRVSANQLGRSVYPGTCQLAEHDEFGNAIRLKLSDPCRHVFTDQVLGEQRENLRETTGDFILRRRDGLYAYQLAVVVDDAAQGVSQVVRGADLLDNTVRQIHLQQALHLEQPSYVHIPLLLDQNGNKLSKQNHAPALNLNRPLDNLQQAWKSLGQPPVESSKNCVDFLDRAIRIWDLRNVA